MIVHSDSSSVIDVDDASSNSADARSNRLTSMLSRAASNGVSERALSSYSESLSMPDCSALPATSASSAMSVPCEAVSSLSSSSARAGSTTGFTVSTTRSSSFDSASCVNWRFCRPSSICFFRRSYRVDGSNSFFSHEINSMAKVPQSIAVAGCERATARTVTAFRMKL